MKIVVRVALLVGIVVALGLVGFIPAAAQSGITVERAINPGSVPASGGEVTVGITITGYSGIGSVVEKLPAGFSYVEDSVTPSELEPTKSGRDLTFSLVDETSFSYKVNATGSAGQHTFSGKLIYGTDKNEVSVSGDKSVRVEAAQSGITVERAINPGSVPASGGEVTVGITITGYSGIGSVVEKLPAGFSYVEDSVTPSELEPTKSGRDLTFSLVDETSFSYKVNATGSAGQHTFSGKLIYGTDKNEVSVSGENRVRVEAAAQSGITVERAINPGSVPASGGEVTVGITITGYSGIGSVVEKLPAGFSYVEDSVTPSELEPTKSGRDLTFSLVDETSFSYKVNATGSAGQHTFSGKLIYGTDKNEVSVSGENRVRVEAAPLPPSRPPSNSAPRFQEGTATTRSVAENTAAGANVGAAVTATDPDGDTPTYALSGADAGHFTIDTMTGQLMTMDALDHEATDSYTVMVTATDDDAMDPMRSMTTVTINVTDVNEVEALTLSPMAPSVGDTITATLDNDDGDEIVSRDGVQWYRSMTMGGTFTRNSGATSMSYEVMAADEDYYLRATVEYTDTHGSQEPLMATTTAAVTAGDPLVIRYDTNPNDGVIQKSEVIAAINDYFDEGADAPSKVDVIKLINLYFGG